MTLHNKIAQFNLECIGALKSRLTDNVAEGVTIRSETEVAK